MKPERLDVTSEELEALLEGVRAPLGEVSYQKLQAAIHTLNHLTELLETREATLEKLRRLLCHSSTEKTGKVLKQAGIETDGKKHTPPGEHTPKRKAPGHGRNSVAAYRGARKVEVPQFPWNRLEGLQKNLGIPLPVATQCEIVKEIAAQVQPAGDELIRQAAAGGD
jgi:hypothetical protein